MRSRDISDVRWSDARLAVRLGTYTLLTAGNMVVWNFSASFEMTGKGRKRFEV